MQRTLLLPTLKVSRILVLLCWLGPVSLLFAQGVPAEPSGTDTHGLKGSHRLTFGLGHTHLSLGKIKGRTEWLPIASWTLNYDYWLSDKMAIGLQNDWILETFIVEHDGDKELERSKPWALVPVFLYKFSDRWAALGGVGMEYSKGHSITMTRIGVEYGLHIPGNWELGAAAVWDGKWGYYNSWGLALTFSKLWKK